MQYLYKLVCPYCAQAADVMWVHGTSRCEHCHTALEEDFASTRLVL